MDKQYKFDETCDFGDIAKEEVIKLLQQYEKEMKILKIGKYKCKLHPSTETECQTELGLSVETLLKDIFKEISKDGTNESGLKELFKIYDEDFAEEMIENAIEYTIDNIILDKFHVKEGDIPEAKSYREILTRENDIENLLKMSKEYKKNNKRLIF